MATLVEDIKEMMSGWNTIIAAAKKQFPCASSEELYQIAKAAMDHSLKLA